MVTIPTIDQISGTTVMNKMRSLINNYIEFGTEVAGSISYMEEVIRNLPQDITDVYNKETIDAMFSNVYSKSEVYTKSEVNDLISTIGSFHAVVVDSLPTYGEEGVIYLLQIDTEGTNIYEEYIWVNRWELIGQLSNVDLDNYYTKVESDTRYYTKTDVYTKTESDDKYCNKATSGTFVGNGYAFGLIITGNMYAVVPAFLPGRRIISFSGNVIARNSGGDIGTYTLNDVTFGMNTVGQCYAFNVPLPGVSTTFNDVTFQMDGTWVIGN